MKTFPILKTNVKNANGLIFSSECLKGMEGKGVPVYYHENQDAGNIVGVAAISVENEYAYADIFFNTTPKGVGLTTIIDCGFGISVGVIGSGKIEKGEIKEFQLTGICVRENG